ncbi:MAG: leucine--tRNA ligase [bacterium]|nr:leucine--tRNA ligase [bacterium]
MAFKKRVTQRQEATQYVPGTIEPQMRQKWEASGAYSTPKKVKAKKYILDMFPYPSGASLHVGHIEGYVGTDIIARYERMKGKSVLHPMGWDAFGLPAENYAIKTGIHPDESTHKNIETFKRQLDAVGLSYDWSSEIDTSDPDFYRWTQWLFILMFKRGLAYKKRADVNWCSSCETVLANEQVVEGKCERCGTEVIQKELEQWFFKITDYADRLISGLDQIDWLEEVKIQQKNWIGRSEGALIRFELVGPVASSSSVRKSSGEPAGTRRDALQSRHPQGYIEVFTTRADTLFGATFLVISPELAQKWLDVGWKAPKEVQDYIKKAGSLPAQAGVKREARSEEKTGVFSGIYAVNPVNKEKIPVWIADFVIGSYGTGAVFADAHDERDFEFAKKYKIPLKPTLKTGDKELDKRIQNLEECFTGDGILVNSGEFTGLTSAEARKKITVWLNKKGHAKAQVQYHLRDWLISRQRYWGAPIPMIYCDACAKDKRGERENMPGWYSVPEKDLPVVLPKDVDFRPTGESPLARSKSFQQNVVCSSCGSDAQREVDTMDTYVDSSWYFIRFVDPTNDKEFASQDAICDWLPVDVYVGGGHVVQHLLFARFFWKVLFDAGKIPKFLGDEPFLKLRAPGWILGPDFRKMSKRWDNVVTPDDIIPKYGADTLRMYEMFMGPFEAMKPWNITGVEGMSRFIKKIWRLFHETIVEDNHVEQDKEVAVLMNKMVKEIGRDIEDMSFNTAISTMMETYNSMVQLREKGVKINWNGTWKVFLLALAPFAPYVTDYLWQECNGGGSSIHKEEWPKYDEKLTQEEMVIIPVQVDGKLRATLELPREDGQERAKVEEKARNEQNVAKYLEGKKVQKVIFVPGRLINFVI